MTNSPGPVEASLLRGQIDEHPLTIDMDDYPYIVEEIQDKRVVDAAGSVEFLVKWWGFSKDECTWEPEANLPRICIREFEEDMWELEKLAGQADKESSRCCKNSKKSKGRRASAFSCPEIPPSSDRRVISTWQARKRRRVDDLLSRRLTSIKSIRLKDGNLEFLCVWEREPFAQIVPRSVLMMKDEYKRVLLDFYEKFVVLARPSDQLVEGQTVTANHDVS
ncbi:hypothetical protein RvY_01189 [Ramazzottius varieornatus]|uniref:Chromo domain-containing protein n=1 Tax=Ramazzottius varieornatus TaxID=947166 RepID=A0A1D1ULI4_RAMVA|nr:hypothetical protein RvY_01189 [Ramazzottius varieornatus]